MVVLQEKLKQKFSFFFKNNLEQSELDILIKNLVIIEPSPGNAFWDSTEGKAGIYFILEGKVRLIDNDDDLIVSLSPGSIFGQLTLFPQSNFQPHKARASLGLKLGYLDIDTLEKVFRSKGNFKNYLYGEAKRWDLLLLNRKINKSNKGSENLLSILAQLEEHQIKEGIISKPLLNKKLWLLRRGEIVHSSGIKIIPGKIFYLEDLPSNGEWLITKAIELYYLENDNRSNSMSIPINKQSDLSLVKSEIVPVKNNSLVLKKEDKKNSEDEKLYFPSPQVKISQWWQHFLKRYPYRKQHSQSDCGVACLIMISEYYGKSFSVNQIRNVANVDRSGSSIKGLIVASEFLGFSPRPVKTDLITLAKQELPAIAHWEGNHYIVVYKITKNKVILCDPKIGRRNITRQEFVEGWTGYTLLLTPTVKFQYKEEAKQNIWKYLELLKPYWLVLTEVFAASLMIQVVSILTPIFTQILFDRVVVQGSIPTLITIAIGMLIFALFEVGISFLRRYLLAHTANKLDLSLVTGFVDRAFKLPLAYFETRFVGDITSRISENEKIREFITGEAITTFLDILSLFVYLIVMFFYSWQLSLLVLIVVPLFVLIPLISTPFLMRISREQFNAKTQEESYLIQAFTGISTIKSMGVERSVRWRWEDLFVKSIAINFSGEMLEEKIEFITQVVEKLSFIFLTVFGVWLVIQQKMTIGQLIAFNMLVDRVISPFETIIKLWNDFQEVRIAVERIDDVLNSPLEQDLTKMNPIVLPKIKGHIRFENVTFRYNLESEKNTLENLSFEIRSGQTIALVGRSGSGKTTISKLLLGLYKPTQGKIFIDGKDISNVSLSSLRQQVGIVDRDSFLFGGTILENLTLAHPNATFEEIKYASELAGAREFIEEFPLKYDTKISEGGGSLSGGQQQRLAITRALLGKPRLLILDEATSNLDPESERIIQNNFKNILNHQTTFIIAHRLSTIRNADLILVIDRGLLVEKGTHKQLMAKKGQYFYLNQQQFAFN